MSYRMESHKLNQIKHKYSKGKKAIILSACAVILIAGGVGVYQYEHRSSHDPVHMALVHKPQGSQYISTAQLPMSRKPQVTQGMNDKAKSALIMDSNGYIEYGKNIDQQRKVASTAKLMTLYLAQAKAQRTHGWSDKITIPSNIAAMSSDSKDGTSAELHLNAGQQYTVEDLYKSALIESSNAAAVALGEWVGGTNKNFVHLMNLQARAWHLKAHFISASGLENNSISKFGLKVSGGKAAGNTMSARDLATVAQHILHDFPSITKWSSQKSMKVHNVTITNINNDLPGQVHSTPGCDGLKTGYTPSAGFCFVGTKKQDQGHRIVVLLGDNGLNIFQDGHDLLLNQKVVSPKPKKHMMHRVQIKRPNRKIRRGKQRKIRPNTQHRMRKAYKRMNRKQKKNF